MRNRTRWVSCYWWESSMLAYSGNSLTLAWNPKRNLWYLNLGRAAGKADRKWIGQQSGSTYLLDFILCCKNRWGVKVLLTIGMNWNCTISPDCAMRSLGVNVKLPFIEPTRTTCTLTCPLPPELELELELELVMDAPLAEDVIDIPYCASRKISKV